MLPFTTIVHGLTNLPCELVLPALLSFPFFYPQAFVSGVKCYELYNTGTLILEPVYPNLLTSNICEMGKCSQNKSVHTSMKSFR